MSKQLDSKKRYLIAVALDVQLRQVDVPVSEVSAIFDLVCLLHVRRPHIDPVQDDRLYKIILLPVWI